MEYVVIGGIAAVVRGVPFITRDLDVSPRRDLDNLDRLAAALVELGATPKIADAPTEIAIPLDGAMIANFANLSLDTPHGQLDLVLLPDGTRGYDDLIRSATRIEVDTGLTVAVADLADVVRSKAAAGRAKDHAQLPILRETLEQSRRLEP
ncbi:MAG: hypothetical protein H0V68_10830 [Actinobacteria bacterium]|nr:hypothetical protein [Actinomycetota bacterium]